METSAPTTDMMMEDPVETPWEMTQRRLLQLQQHQRHPTALEGRMSANTIFSTGPPRAVTATIPVMTDPQRQQQLLQVLSLQQQQQQQQRPVMPNQVSVIHQPAVLPLPLPSLQHTLLLSPLTGAVVGVEPLTTTTAAMASQQQYPMGVTSQQQPPHAAVIHNLIPEHLQASALAPSLNGTPGHQPALILPPQLAAAVVAAAHATTTTNNNNNNNNNPQSAQDVILQTLFPVILQQQQQHQLSLALPSPFPLLLPLPALPPLPALTVQDRPAGIPTIYNGVNVGYPGVTQVHQHPPVYIVDNFLSSAECDFLIQAAEGSWTPAPVVGKGIGEISPSRTSSTCYLAREDLPDYMRKVSLLTGKPVLHCELPQVGRYLPSQRYLHHFDAFDLSNEDGRRFAANGGQRVVTVLVYLKDCAQGGQTEFPAMNLQVSPRKGTALVFFPATVDGYLDKMALHAALPAIDTKYVSQVWIRQGNYLGQPSKRLPNTLGVPFDASGKENSLLGIQPAP